MGHTHLEKPSMHWCEMDFQVELQGWVFWDLDRLGHCMCYLLRVVLVVSNYVVYPEEVKQQGSRY